MNKIYRFVINDGKSKPTKEERKKINIAVATIIAHNMEGRRKYYIKRAKQLHIKLEKSPLTNDYVITSEIMKIVDKKDFEKLPKWQQEEIKRGGW